jgi:hypothetical protein
MIFGKLASHSVLEVPSRVTQEGFLYFISNFEYL